MNSDRLPVDHSHSTSGVNVGDFLKGLEQKRMNNVLLVPTDDDEVKQMLRQLEEPITLFGEDRGDRRDRLIKIITEKQVDVSTLVDEDAEEDVEMDVPDEEFYTPASEELVEARKNIALFSANRAQQRLLSLGEQSKIPLEEHLVKRRQQIQGWKQYELIGSQLVSTRPVSTVAISPLSSSYILTGSWGGEIRLLSRDLEILREIDSPEGKIGGLDWSPTEASIFATSGDSIHLWNIDSDKPMMELSGHTNRVVRSKFHPSGKYLASASFDMTWRLWDLNTQQEILLQEGHSKEVYTIGFHPDGSLLASAGLDAMGYIWDLRSGKSVMVLDGHIKPIYGLDWRSNGTNLVTGSADGSIKVWDLRSSKELETIPAHNKIVSDVKFHGDLLVSSSYDNTLKLYNADNWISVSSLEGHSDKVMAVDICDDYIVSTGWDRSAKKWAIQQ
jgi:U4/U6 small nuclear ribonucleoprotein PRP4